MGFLYKCEKNFELAKSRKRDHSYPSHTNHFPIILSITNINLFIIFHKKTHHIHLKIKPKHQINKKTTIQYTQ